MISKNNRKEQASSIQKFGGSPTMRHPLSPPSFASYVTRRIGNSIPAPPAPPGSSTPIYSPEEIWDVSAYPEFGHPERRAIGRYVVDLSRGLTQDGMIAFIGEGGFGIAVDVLDLDDPLRTPYVLRISADEEMFDKLRDLTSMITTRILDAETSPYFLRTRTNFSAGEFPALAGEEWEFVAALIDEKFGRGLLVNNKERPQAAVPVRLYYTIMERAQLFDLRAGLLDQWSAVPDVNDRAAHGLNDFKLALAFQMTQAVAALHKIGIAHRDITTGNIVLSERPSPVRVDVFDVRHTDADRDTTYEIPRFQTIPGVSGVDRDPATVIIPHIIDYDLAMRLVDPPKGPCADTRLGKSERVLYGSSRIRGSPETIAPEVVFLSDVGLNQDPDLFFKPDVYSLGVLVGEIVTGYSIFDLLFNLGEIMKIQVSSGDPIGFREELAGQDSIEMLHAAYTGFPSMGDIAEYEAIRTAKIAALQDTQTPDGLETELETIFALQEDRVRLDEILERGDSGTKRDWFLQVYGIPAEVFDRGALFFFLDQQAQTSLVPSTLIRWIRAATSWDVRSRPLTDALLAHPLFAPLRRRDHNVYSFQSRRRAVTRGSAFPVKIVAPESRRRKSDRAGVGADMCGICGQPAAYALETRNLAHNAWCSSSCARIAWTRHTT